MREQTPVGHVDVTAINICEATMVQLEVVPAQVEVLAQEERERIEESLARSGVDSAAFWHAVALIYRRGLSDHMPPEGRPPDRFVCCAGRPLPYAHHP